MSDYKVKFLAEDNLTGTLSKVKQELNTVGNASSKLDQIAERFQRIESSSAPLKRKLRELQTTMAQMNLDGLNNTEILTKMAAKAGEYKDAIGDATQATRLLSSDTANLDAGIQAMQGLAGAATIATGVMGLLGTKNEDVERAILKVQSALGILNGVQSLANTLNKDSILMLKLKQIVTAANTSATTTNTVGTVANTAATAANNLANKTWNVTKAIGKALLGDFTGLLLIGAGALLTYGIATSKSTEAEEEHKKAIDNTKESVDTFTNTLSNSFASLMTSYSQLKAQWKALSTTHQKRQWIEENKNKLEELGIAVNGVISVEDSFNKNTNAVVQGFMARAKAAAYLAKLTENYKKQIELIEKINTQQAKATAEAASKPKVTAGQTINDNTYKNSRYGSVNSAGQWVFSQKGADIYNTGKSDGNKYVQGFQKQLQGLQSEANNTVNLMAKELEKVPAIAHSNKSNKTVSAKNTSKTDSTKKATFNADANTLKEMQENVTVLQQKLNGLDVHSDQFKEVAKDIDFWKRKIEDVNRGFELGSITDYEKQIKGINDVLQNANLTETQRNKLVKERAKLEETIKSKEVKGYANGSISDLNEQKNNIQKRLTNENLTIDTRLKLITKVNDLQECIDNISDFTTIKVKKVTVENQNKLDSFDNAQSMIDTIIKQRQLGIIDKDTAIKQIEDIKTQLEQIGIDPIKLNIESNAEAKLNSATDALNSFGSSLSMIGQGFEIPELNIAGMMAQAIATMIQGYATATSQAASLGPWAWVAFAALGATQLAAMVSQVKSMGSFANGGIITGGNTHGDMLTAKVNAGEMILNGRQQRNLFNLLDEGGAVGGGTQTVSFKLRGSDIYGSLKNYKGIKGKVNKNI